MPDLEGNSGIQASAVSHPDERAESVGWSPGPSGAPSRPSDAPLENWESISERMVNRKNRIMACDIASSGKQAAFPVPHHILGLPVETKPPDTERFLSHEA